MKSRLLFLSLTLLTISCQTDYYLLGDDIYSEKEARASYEETIKTLPQEYYFKPTIYHRIERGDSILNYVKFIAHTKDSSYRKHKFKFEYKQDSLFLLLEKKLPEFILRDLDGNEFSCSQLLGKPALLNYWSVYCSPCVAEIPDLNLLKAKYDTRVNFIALTEAPCDDDSLEDFLDKHPFDFHILQNAQNYKTLLNIKSVPINIFIDKDGIVRYIHGNYPLNWDGESRGIEDKENTFVTIIEKLLAEK